MWADLKGVLGDAPVEQYLPALLIIALGLLLARVLGGWTELWIGELRGPRAGVFAKRVVMLPVFALACVVALYYLNVDLSIFLGAAGALTLLVGVAGKSAASEVVSGLFLIGDRPFRPGDSVKIGSVEGQVLSIDWLAVRVRTWQNTVVRIPNESVIKGEVTNLSSFPIRRCDIFIDLAHGQELEPVRKLLLDLADATTYCLETPVPLVRVAEFGSQGPRLAFFAWLESERFFDDRAQLMIEVHSALLAAGVQFARLPIFLSSDEGSPTSLAP